MTKNLNIFCVDFMFHTNTKNFKIVKMNENDGV